MTKPLPSHPVARILMDAELTRLEALTHVAHYLIRQNTALQYRLLTAETGNEETALQEAAVAAVLALAALEGQSVDTLSDELFDRVLEEVGSDAARL